MSDISVSERRLSAALDRIDQLLEAGTGHRRDAQASADTPDRAAFETRIEDLQSENTRLAGELAALRADRGGPLEAALAEARTRLTGASEQAARLSAANEELAEANRVLIEAASSEGGSEDASIAALEAEIEALRAARAAEIAQMGDIMQELERLLSEDDQRPATSASRGTPPRPRRVRRAASARRASSATCRRSRWRGRRSTSAATSSAPRS